MGNKILLQNFSSIFEILSVYYLATASSEKFKSFFGINETFGGTLINDKFFNILRTISNDKGHMDLKVLKCMTSAIEAQKLHYNLLKSNNFFNSIRPFYIYFGVLAFSFLLLGGLQNEWHRTYSLLAINCLTVIMALLLIINVFRVGDDFKHMGPGKPFLLSISVISILIFVPESWARGVFPNSVMDINLLPDYYSDSHVICAIASLFFPLIMHIGRITLFIFKLKWLKRSLIRNKIMDKTIIDNMEKLYDEKKSIFEPIPSL